MTSRCWPLGKFCVVFSIVPPWPTVRLWVDGPSLVTWKVTWPVGSEPQSAQSMAKSLSVTSTTLPGCPVGRLVPPPDEPHPAATASTTTRAASVRTRGSYARRRWADKLRRMTDQQDFVIDPGVDIGHVHLKVSDLDRALGFYRDVLGFELQRGTGDQAAFLSAGGYHHHIGLNIWQSRAAARRRRRARPACSTWRSSTPRAHDLARALVSGCCEPGVPIEGASDHGVSEAHLPARSGRQRHRAVPRPAARRVAARRGR